MQQQRLVGPRVVLQHLKQDNPHLVPLLECWYRKVGDLGETLGLSPTELAGLLEDKIYGKQRLPRLEGKSSLFRPRLSGGSYYDEHPSAYQELYPVLLRMSVRYGSSLPRILHRIDVVSKDISKEVLKEVSMDVAKEVSSDRPSDRPKKVSSDWSSDVPKDISSDVSSDRSKGASSDVPKDVPKDASSDGSNDIPKNTSFGVREDIQVVSEKSLEPVGVPTERDHASDEESIPTEPTEDIITRAKRQMEETEELVQTNPLLDSFL